MTAFGVEIEILLSLKEVDDKLNKESDLYEFADWFVEKYNYWAESEFRIYTDIDSTKDETEEGDEWIITDDLSLKVNDSSV
jgi:hypothetical protein